MEKTYSNNKFIKFMIIFLLVVLFPNASYSIQKNNETPKQVILGGELLQLDIATSKLMFYSKDNDNLVLKNYDLLESIEGKTIEKIYNKKVIKNISKKDIVNLNLKMNDYDQVRVNVIRNKKHEEFILSKKEIHHSNFVDKIPFSASLTFIDPSNNTFAAVGHNMNINNNNNLLSENGYIHLCNLSQIQKSTKNNVGYMQGNIVYNKQGNISKICDFGAIGYIKDKEILKNNEIYVVGDRDDVTVGEAQIAIKDNVNSEKHLYDINIIKVNKQNRPEKQSFEFKVIDEELIKNYGGIVQGMSGCPIIQNGKIIGALSHVICNDTTKGIGIYIKWMMED